MPYLLCAILMASQSGPVLHWKGDDGAAPTTAVDSSGNGHSGTYTNGATTSTLIPTLQFPNSRSFIFDGTNDQVLNASLSWPVGGPVTVSFWNFVATAELTSSSGFTVGNLGDPQRFQAHCPWSDRIFMWDYGNYLTSGRVVAVYNGYFDKWTHVALVSQGVGGSFAGIYFDGVLVSSTPVSDGPTVALTGLTLGAWPFSNDFHRGKIDDFRIYNRVLTSSQIQLLAAGHTEPAAPTALVATGAAGQIQLSWTAAVGAGGYNVKRGTTTGGPYTTIASPTGTTYDDTTATAGTPFFYVVTTLGVNESAASNEASAVAAPGPPPPPPQIQNVTVEGCGGIGLEAILLAALVRALRQRQGAARRRPA